MANQGLTTSQAAQLGAKTLWIGDIEPWMDENYISGLFSGVSYFQYKLTLLRLRVFPQ
jgi:hypothetical protein